MSERRSLFVTPRVHKYSKVGTLHFLIYYCGGTIKLASESLHHDSRATLGESDQNGFNHGFIVLDTPLSPSIVNQCLLHARLSRDCGIVSATASIKVVR